MKALILVGGFGTRLRPLTFSMPKPCVEFCNKPIVCHQIEALAKVGVTEIVLAINYQPEMMRESIEKYTIEYGVKIIVSQETTPLGTAGPLALAKDILTRDNPEGSFFVLNSDIICDYPFQEMIDSHRAHGKEGTLVVFPVSDPSRYGVVVTNETNEIISFVEKPKEFISNKINAGMYLLKTSVLDRIEIRPTSIEREIFPAMAADRQLSAVTLNSFWMDIGIPKDYLTGTELFMAHFAKKSPEKLARGSKFIGNVIVDPSAEIEDGCLIGPNVCIGSNCKVKSGTRISNSVIFSDTEISSHSWINGSIIGWKNKIGRWVRIEGLSVFGEDVVIKDEVMLNGTIILPHKEVKDSEQIPGKILL